MPLISKCHFEDEFRDLLHWIEERFDLDHDNGIYYGIEGLDYGGLSELLTRYRNMTLDGLWDIMIKRHHAPQTETIIKDSIVVLLYLLKKVREENEKCVLAHK